MASTKTCLDIVPQQDFGHQPNQPVEDDQEWLPTAATSGGGAPPPLAVTKRDVTSMAGESKEHHHLWRRMAAAPPCRAADGGEIKCIMEISSEIDFLVEGFDLLLERTQGRKLSVQSSSWEGVRSSFWREPKVGLVVAAHIPMETGSSTFPSNRDRFEALESSTLWMKEKIAENSTNMTHMQGAITSVTNATEENMKAVEGMRQDLEEDRMGTTAYNPQGWKRSNSLMGGKLTFLSPQGESLDQGNLLDWADVWRMSTR
ncbi:hypothetical protein CJ030_MR1G012650 [Morella rubra]|uniref:Uncharacterized protein n=1 Tax=Morella rubra TaxID=262757 RepID=A0A6A1WSZ7_9ROSI|nr:hypothetical protein CJ030_MR1G012650 [Morella rubra]